MKTQKIHKINYYLALNIPKFNKKKTIQRMHSIFINENK